jgi:hypothetical protein
MKKISLNLFIILKNIYQISSLKNICKLTTLIDNLNYLFYIYIYIYIYARESVWIRAANRVLKKLIFFAKI